MTCDCMSVLDERLKEHNSKISVDFRVGAGTLTVTPHIQTEKLEPRKRDKMGVIATFCPFCGVRYEEQP